MLFVFSFDVRTIRLLLLLLLPLLLMLLLLLLSLMLLLLFLLLLLMLLLMLILMLLLLLMLLLYSSCWIVYSYGAAPLPSPLNVRKCFNPTYMQPGETPPTRAMK